MKGDDIMKEMVKTCLGQKSNEIKVLLLENRRAMKQTEENLLEKIKQLKNQVEELKLREWELMGLVKLRQEKEEKIAQILFEARLDVAAPSSNMVNLTYPKISESHEKTIDLKRKSADDDEIQNSKMPRFFPSKATDVACDGSIKEVIDVSDSDDVDDDDGAEDDFSEDEKSEEEKQGDEGKGVPEEKMQDSSKSNNAPPVDDLNHDPTEESDASQSHQVDLHRGSTDGARGKDLKMTEPRKDHYPVELFNGGNVESVSSRNTRRRRRNKKGCGDCLACQTESDCDECRHCMDRPRNGGKFTLRQKCLARKCEYVK